MTIYAVIAGLLVAITSLAADVNITNVTKAATIPAGSFALGTTGLVTRLLPVDQIGGSQVWTNSSGYVFPSGIPPDLNGVNPGPLYFFATNGGFFEGRNNTADWTYYLDRQNLWFVPLGYTGMTSSNDCANALLEVNVIDNVDYGRASLFYVEVIGHDTNPHTLLSVSANGISGPSSEVLLEANPNGVQTVGGSIVVKYDSSVVFRVSTNGVITGKGLSIPQLPWIPTNNIPTSSSGITNYVLCNLSNTVAGTVGGPCYIATNHSAAGSFIILKPAFTQSTWP